ncbi:TonB-dependent receptor [Spongiibacter nanhainus]|uniref:TonB-dependent receptor n=1 Tax=Spongiibacter nanhainus TaxID=2794344 RepID=A0A7T4QYX3_9GAMM|nr:TonB-dependent receptor [Spongiibacter nanhainus]QQD17266.1 TonB-dependent receptor [Spongiibacter nanhainus]
MKHRSLKPATLLACTAAFGLTTSLSYAQGDATRRTIEEVIVTAQKSEQSLQDVPVSVSTVKADELRESGIFGAEGIENQVPNLQLDGDPQAPSIGIRGFSTDSYNVGLEPSVGIMVDDVFIGRSEFIPDGLFDMQGIEVLRGPQGTLFGKNTIAGVLIFSSADPSEEFDGQLQVTGGELGTRRVEAGLSAPLGDRLLSRIAFTHWETDGEVENSFLNRDELSTEQTAGRIKIEADVSDRLLLKLGVQVSETDHNYPGWQLYDLDSDALAYAQSQHAPTEDNPYDGHTAFDLPGYVKRDSEIAHLIAEYDAGEFLGLDNTVVTGIVSHAALTNDMLIDFDVSAADLVTVTPVFDYTQDALELRINGSRNNIGWGDGLDIIAGIFAMQADIDAPTEVALGEDMVDFVFTPAGAEALGLPESDIGSILGPLLNNLPIPGVPLDDGVRSLFTQSAESLALFGQATWYFNERWSAIIGLRLGQESKDARRQVASYGPGLTGLVLSAEDVDRRLSRDENEVSPKLGLRYELNPAVSLYGSWTRGFKSGGFNAISFQGSNLEFEPEQADAFELGMKSLFFDETLSINAALYHTRVTDMQVVNFNGVGFDVFNAEGAELQGLELDFSWLPPLQWLTFDGSLGLSSAEYVDYRNGPPTATQQDAAAPGETPQQDLSGRTLPRAPEVSASLRPTVFMPLSADLGLQFSLGVSYRSEQYLTLDLDEKSRQGGYTLLDARIVLGPEDGFWSLALSGTNLGDKSALNFVADHNLFARSYFANQIAPRSLKLSLSANW